jgi:hypothetical protein
MTGRSLPALAAMAQVLLLTGVARAQDPAAAEVLFQEGRRLIAEGRVAAGCDKLKESFALDAMSGTLLNLADCYEKAGKTATAWARFRNAASLAQSQNKAEQAAEANRRAKALEAQLSYITITVPDAVPGLEVRRNDLEVTPGMFGVAVPVDPGEVEVVASAPGHKSVRMTVDLGSRREKKVLTIPKLAPGHGSETVNLAAPPPEAVAKKAETSKVSQPEAKEPAPKPLPRTESKPEPESSASTTQTDTVSKTGHEGPGITPWIVGGAGAAFLVTGGVFGLLAMQSNSEALDHCPARQGCSRSVMDAIDTRNTQATVANISVGVGLVGIATATVWLLVAKPRSREQQAGLLVRPEITRDVAGMWATGRF